jgi:hypothetical protein
VEAPPSDNKLLPLLGGTIGRCACLAALAWMSGMSATMASDSPQTTRATSTAQGRTWDSIKRLPDWSGVWVLSDDSWGEVMAAASGRDNGRLPLSPQYTAIRAAQSVPDFTQFSNESKCIPVGIPESMAIPIGHEYLFSPGRVTVIFENGIVRRIDTSGRSHPSDKELDYTFAGNSIGHWEGGTLVVDTIGISPQAEFIFGLHTTSKTHLTENISRRNNDTLQIDTVMTDPEILTKPWKYSRLYTRSTLPPFEYYPCVEGNRDVMVGGKQTGVDLTPPPASNP